jgi:predicted metal-dependent hydrolase
MLFEQAQLGFESPPSQAFEPELRFSTRARRLSVRVHRNARIEIVAPLKMSRRRIVEFIAQHREWIARQQARALARAPRPEPFPPQAIALAAFDERWAVHLGGGLGSLRIRELTTGELTVGGLTARVLSIRGQGDAAQLRLVLRRWLIRHAGPRIESVLQELVASGLPTYRRLSMRFQRSRWGSCSVRGTISLNAAMLFQRPEVARYLMIHELTHLEHPNHSARFWRAVAARCPEWRALDRELLQGWQRVPSWLFA